MTMISVFKDIHVIIFEHYGYIVENENMEVTSTTLRNEIMKLLEMNSHENVPTESGKKDELSELLEEYVNAKPTHDDIIDEMKNEDNIDGGQKVTEMIDNLKGGNVEVVKNEEAVENTNEEGFAGGNVEEVHKNSNEETFAQIYEEKKEETNEETFQQIYEEKKDEDEKTNEETLKEIYEEQKHVDSVYYENNSDEEFFEEESVSESSDDELDSRSYIKIINELKAKNNELTLSGGNINRNLAQRVRVINAFPYILKDNVK